MKKGIIALLLIFVMLFFTNLAFAEDNQTNDPMLFIYSIIDTTDTYVDLDAVAGDTVTFSIVLQNSGTTKKNKYPIY